MVNNINYYFRLTLDIPIESLCTGSATLFVEVCMLSKRNSKENA